MNELERSVWKTLKTNSRRALRKTKTRGRKPYYYIPRGHLLERISEDFNISKDRAYDVLISIRTQLLARQNQP